MRLDVLAVASLLLPFPTVADTVVAARTLRSHTVLTESDVAIVAGESAGAISNISEVIGMETRVTIYEGRPLRPGDLGPAALVERNQIITLAYAAGGLSIVTEGRALGRAGAGETVRVMNLSSRTTVSGVVSAGGMVVVGAAPTLRQ